MAECHPVGFQWVMEAKARGATIIHVDPHFSRTSALAHTYVPVRAGEPRVDVNDLRAAVLGLDHPLEADRVALGHVRPHDHDAV